MRVVRLDRFGTPDVLRPVDAPDPSPGPGEVLVRVRAAGINNIDLRIRAGTSGLPVRLPHVLGMEFAGEIVDLGPGVTGRELGERVTPFFQVSCGRCHKCAAGLVMHCRHLQQYGIHRAGGYAEYAVADARGLLPVAAGSSWDAAVSVQTTFGTAWRCLVTQAELCAGETVLVSAAGSGIGSAAVQIAKLFGARVIASAGTDEKRDLALELGADEVVDHTAPDLTEQVLALTDGRGVDVALSHVGAPLFPAELDAVAIGGRITVCGAHAGAVSEIDLQQLFRTERRIVGSARATPEELRSVLGLVAAGRLRPVVAHVLPLRDAAYAHRLLEQRDVFGRLVLRA